MPLTKNKTPEPPRAEAKGETIRANLLKHFPKVVQDFVFDELVKQHSKGIFSGGELQEIEGKCDRFRQSRAYLLALLDKDTAESEKGEKREAGQSAGVLVKFLEILESTCNWDVLCILEDNRDAVLTDSLDSGPSDEEVFWLQGLLKEASEAAREQLEIIKRRYTLQEPCLKLTELRALDKRILESEEKFWGIDREFLFDHCSKMTEFLGKVKRMLYRTAWASEPLGLDLARIVDVEDVESVRGLYIALKESGCMEVMRANRTPEQREACRVARKKLLDVSNAVFYFSPAKIDSSEDVLSEVHSKGLMLDYDYKRLLSMRDQRGRAEGLLNVIGTALWRRGADVLDQFLICLEKQHQLLVCRLFEDCDYTDDKAERFNQNWQDNRDLLLNEIEGEAWLEEWLSVARFSNIINGLSKDGIITASWGNELEKEGVHGNADYRLVILGDLLSGFLFHQVFRALRCINRQSPELGKRLETDDIRQYEVDQLNRCRMRLVWLVALVAKGGVDFNKTANEILVRRCFEYRSLTKYSYPKKLQRAIDTCAWSQWNFFPQSKTAKPTHAEERPSAPELEKQCLLKCS